MTRDSNKAAMTVAPDRSRNRVLRWLNDPGARSQGAAVDDSPVLQAPAPFGPTLSARQRVGQLWKRWKSKALGIKPDDSSLSPAVLKHHQQLCELHRVSSIGFAADAGCDASSALAAAAGLPWAAAHGHHPLPGVAAQDVRGSAAQAPGVQQPSDVAAAYSSSFYQPSCSNLPPGPSPVVCKPDELTYAVTASGGSMHRSAAAVNSPLPSSNSCSSAVTPTGETSSPSVTPRGVSVLRRSTANSSFNQTHSSNPGHHGALPATTRSSQDWGAPVLQQQILPQQLGGGDAVVGDEAAAAQHTAAPASPALLPLPPQFGQRSPLQHNPELWTTGNIQLQQLLQGPKQQSLMQQLRPAAANNPRGPLLPAGTALTAYPAVAAALNSTAAGWLQRSAASTHTAALVQQGSLSADTPHQEAVTAAPPAQHKQGSSAAVPAPDMLSLQSPFETAAGHCAAAAATPALQPSQQAASPAEAASATRASSTTHEDVQDWLLRTAVLEDELQGRAMEVAEELQVLQERREVLASLTQALQQSPAGSSEHEAAVQSAVSSLGAGKSSVGSLYRAGCVAESGRPRTPGIRSQVCAELNRLDLHLSQLQGRAAGLGSALATLQGCQAVLGSNKGATLRPCSRLAVLQLVLSDVVARLPAERLQELPVLEGLPSLDTEAREICRLAEASSIQASVEPLLHAGAYPPPAQQQQEPHPDASVAPDVAHASICQASSGLHGGLHRQGSGFSRCSDATGTSYSRPAAVAPAQPSSAQQQQQPWYADLKPGGEDDDDDDDDILDSISSVLSSKHYTPRLSLSYESRKAAAAAEARRTAAVLAQRPASAIAPTGSAAAAGAAALTLANIASSGSWSQWPPEESCSELGAGSSKHAGMWDMLCVHTPRSSAAPSQHKWQQQQHQLLPQPSSPSSVASSRRGIGKAGLPYPLPSWPESPTAAAVVPGLQDSPQGPPTPQTAATVLKLPAGSATPQHHCLTALFGQLQQSAGSWTAPDVGSQLPASVPQSGGLQSSMQPAAPAPASSGGEVAQGATVSRSSSFESCVSARSRFSMEVFASNLAGLSTPAQDPVPAAQVNNSSTCDGRQPNTVVQAGGRAGGHTGATGAAPCSSLMDASVAAALPAGVDLNSMTVGELLCALSSAVSSHTQVSGRQPFSIKAPRWEGGRNAAGLLAMLLGGCVSCTWCCQNHSVWNEDGEHCM